ncbi:Glycosyl transferase family 2 [compost metagenome]
MVGIARQTLTPKVVYVIDNGSELEQATKCFELLKNISLDEIEVFFLSTTRRGNANYARNLGLDLANTRYVAYLDSDDWWEDHHLENSIAALEKTEKAGIYSGSIIHSHGTRINYSADIEQLASPTKLLFSEKKFIAQTSTYVIDKSKLGGSLRWDERLKRHQDYDFFINVHYNSKGWAFLSKPECNLDWKTGGTKGKLDYKSMIAFLKKWEARFEPKELNTYLYRQLISCVETESHRRYLNYYRLKFLRANRNSFLCKLKSSSTLIRARNNTALIIKKIIKR